MTIAKAIQLHGASAVYKAAHRHMAGDKKNGLSTVGLSVTTMGEVYDILSAAYAEMGDAARAIDYADSTATLAQIVKGGKR